MLSTNTHTYDGHIFPRDFKKSTKTFDATLSEIRMTTNDPRILMTIELLDRDRKNNYDAKNNMNVQDILPTVWEKGPQDLVLEQLADIQDGFCPQGRVARLYQLIWDEKKQDDESEQ
jgi:hypothetical protein